jgi:hypothetical protein
MAIYQMCYFLSFSCVSSRAVDHKVNSQVSVAKSFRSNFIFSFTVTKRNGEMYARTA